MAKRILLVAVLLLFLVWAVPAQADNFYWVQPKTTSLYINDQPVPDLTRYYYVDENNDIYLTADCINKYLPVKATVNEKYVFDWVLLTDGKRSYKVQPKTYNVMRLTDGAVALLSRETFISGGVFHIYAGDLAELFDYEYGYDVNREVGYLETNLSEKANSETDASEDTKKSAEATEEEPAAVTPGSVLEFPLSTNETKFLSSHEEKLISLGGLIRLACIPSEGAYLGKGKNDEETVGGFDSEADGYIFNLRFVADKPYAEYRLNMTPDGPGPYTPVQVPLQLTPFVQGTITLFGQCPNLMVPWKFIYRTCPDLRRYVEVLVVRGEDYRIGEINFDLRTKDYNQWLKHLGDKGKSQNNTGGDKNVDIVVDGKEINSDVAPEIVNGRTMVPLRVISEALGATVQYLPGPKKVIIIRGDTLIILTIGKAQATVNNNPKTLDSPPYIKNNRTMVPLRFVVEMLECAVEWNEDTRTVSVVSGDETQQEENQEQTGVSQEKPHPGFSVPGPVTTYINGVKIPTTVEYVYYLPYASPFISLEAIEKFIGWKGSYDPETGTVTLRDGNRTATLSDAATFEWDGRVYVEAVRVTAPFYDVNNLPPGINAYSLQYYYDPHLHTLFLQTMWDREVPVPPTLPDYNTRLERENYRYINALAGYIDTEFSNLLATEKVTPENFYDVVYAPIALRSGEEIKISHVERRVRALLKDSEIEIETPVLMRFVFYIPMKDLVRLGFKVKPLFEYGRVMTARKGSYSAVCIPGMEPRPYKEVELMLREFAGYKQRNGVWVYEGD
ncbi:MAG: copper amine oxidase N-terminal domain-containing protein [Bacillota bacterium]